MHDQSVTSGEAPTGGRLVANIMHFARLLRAAGIPVGPGRVIDGLRAVRAVGVTRKSDFYWALHAVFVHRSEQRALFDHAFRRFWRETAGAENLPLPSIPAPPSPRPVSPPPGRRRVADALGNTLRRGPRREREGSITHRLRYSDREILGRKDFAQMTAEEIEEAERALERLELLMLDRTTRRSRTHPRGRIDMRRTLRASVRAGGGGISLRRRMPKHEPPTLVALCDISGSMGPYTRMFLRFLHALSNDGRRIRTFLFATRLSHVTGLLQRRDIDEALARLGDSVEDWSGGTRIGECLHAFNRHWSRRVLAHGAVVLLITDGLDRDGGRDVAHEMDRLHRSCRRLIWLNPLLRYAAFEPKATGIRAMLPHVDEFRPVHDLRSLGDLVDALGSRPGYRPRSRPIQELKARQIRGTRRRGGAASGG